ncbi:MAG: GIY-YIG nuclease family protein [Candidatus Peribacteraceae bacterium]|nr:GIY-YIG nuclease family protein [Candidatus Peribacteraceae bacterium]
MRRTYCVYILRCSDGSYYTGVTNSLERRLEEHASGIDSECYTFERRPVKLVYTETFSYIWNAIEREKILKDWSTKKKEALINGNTQALRLHSKKKFPEKGQRKLTGVRFRRLQNERFRMRCGLYAVFVPRTFAPPARTTRDDKDDS